VTFCYGAFNNTTPGGSAPSTISITGATVLELSEPSASGTTAPATPLTSTTPEAPPYATPIPLISQTFTPAISESYGCRTISPASAAAIPSGAYLSLVLGVSFSTGNWTGNDPEGTISLGRVTATYSP
jgi:hypothetical protein